MTAIKEGISKRDRTAAQRARIREGKAARARLRGSVLKYDNPTAPAIVPREGEVNAWEHGKDLFGADRSVAGRENISGRVKTLIRDKLRAKHRG